MKSNWYPIQVMAGEELTLCLKITQRIPRDLYEECFVPQVDWLFRTGGKVVKNRKPLFPGYFFLITDHIEEIFHKMKQIPDFVKIIREDFLFVPIEQEEANLIVGLENKEHVIEPSEGYIVDSKVFVTSGSLKGLEGIIKKVDRHKRVATIEVSFFSQPVVAKVPLEIVSKM